MGDLERISRPVLSEEELVAQLTDAGKTADEIDATLIERATARMKAQASYDKAPPKYYRRVKP